MDLYYSILSFAILCCLKQSNYHFHKEVFLDTHNYN